MSASRSKGSRKAAVIRENALTGQTTEEVGIFSFTINVGRMTLKPDTKYF